MTKLIKVYGDAGTGKTTWCINQIEGLLNAGVDINSIGYLTFSKSQASDAKRRILERTGISLKQNPHIGTFHSVCTKQLSILPENYLKRKHKSEFCKTFGIEYFVPEKEKETKKEDADESEDALEFAGNTLIEFYNRCVNYYAKDPVELTNEEKLKVFALCGFSEKHNFFDLPIDKFFSEYYAYKKKNNLFDFDDILLINYKKKLVPQVEYLFIDEVQDMGFLLQCLFFTYHKSGLIRQIALIGDEKQTIYRYLGASPIWFINLKADEEVTFEKTYRCPKKVWELAKKIEHKMKEKAFRIVKDNGTEGELHELTGVSFDYILGLLNQHKDEKSFLLFRTNNFENQFRQFLDSNQFVYKGLRRSSMFTDKLINLHNGFVKILLEQPLTWLEVDYLMNYVPANPFFARGSKTDWKRKKNTYPSDKEFSHIELAGLGFAFGLFGGQWKNREHLINVVDLSEKQKMFLLDYKPELIQADKVFSGTIHSSKGLEAVNVFLFVDSPIKMELTEGELNIWYTGVTRSKLRLFCVFDLFDKANSDIFCQSTT